MSLRDDIVAAARSRLGISFLHQGRTNDGLDCLGLVQESARDCGLTDAQIVGYSRQPNEAEFRRQLAEHLIPVHVNDRLPGDVLTFAPSGSEQHLGILATAVTFVHAYALRPCKVIEVSLAPWLPRLRGVWRFPELA
jgi:cell wall-associated NlpC family hydrolase